MKRLKPEILAPAGNIDSLRAAVNSGADAVYFGVGTFNARAKAENFSVESLTDAVAYAHFNGVKVYLTVNTLIKNEEMPEVLAFVAKAVKAGTDAFIVQDLGLAMLIKRNFPTAVLHASTQMGVHNAAGARLLKKLGFKRVVLSREVTLQDIREVASEGLEVEYFVQGALCVAFSGNCYMSANALGKSGNRGLCAQLCRPEYCVEYNGKKVGTSHYLSAADLCLLDRVQELAEAGVGSFKIEGRLRRPAYVAEAVTAYRNAVDGTISDKQKVKQRLAVAFSRGKFNEGEYLSGKIPQRIIEDKLYNHCGVPIGRVESVAPFKNIYEITISSRHEISSGDGLKLFDESGKEAGSLGVGGVTKIGRNLYKVCSSAYAQKGFGVHLITDAVREKELLSVEKKPKVGLKVVAMSGKPLEIQACGGGAVANYVGGIVEEAQNIPTSREEIALQCGKCGGSAFEVTDVQVTLDRVFVPKSVINAARREVLERLKGAITDKAAVCDNITLSQVWNFAVEKASDRCFGDLNGCKVIYPEDWHADCVKRDIACSNGGNILLGLPIICMAADRDIIMKALAAVRNDIDGVIANNLWGLELVELGYKVVGGFGLNIYNKWTLNVLRSMGMKEAYISEEGDLTDFAEESGVWASDKNEVPVMTLAHCPFRAVFGGDCGACKYSSNMTYAAGGRKYIIKRTKLSRCYFALYLIK